MERQRLEVDGVPVFAVASDGPTEAGLLFRVGAVDEPPARRGITHLTEHITLAALPRPDHPFNGATGTTFTTFFGQGTAVEVGAFLAAVCESLAGDPGPRFETERRILSTEALGQGPASVVESLLAFRYGVRGWGALDLGEVGLSAVTVEEVVAWRTQWFTSANVAAWVVAPDPTAVIASLPLPAGEPALPVEPVPVLDRLPAWAHANVAGPGVGMVGTRSFALKWAIGIVADRAAERLRDRDGIVYGVVPTYEPMTGSTCHVHVGADSLEEHRERVLPGLLEALHGVRVDGPSDIELARARRAVADERAHTPLRERALAWAASDAARHLEGVDPETPDELLRLESEVGPDEISRSLEAVSASAVAVVPLGASPPSAPWAEIPQWSSPVDRRTLGGAEMFRSTREPPELLAVGRSFLSLTVPGGNQVVIRADQCPLVLTEDDGSRAVYGDDGFRVVVHPWLWRKGPEAVHAIDRFAPRSNYVRIGAGRADPPRPPLPRWVEMVAWPIAAVSIFLILQRMVDDDPRHTTADAVVVPILAVMAVCAAVAIWIGLTRRKAAARP